MRQKTTGMEVKGDGIPNRKSANHAMKQKPLNEFKKQNAASMKKTAVKLAIQIQYAAQFAGYEDGYADLIFLAQKASSILGPGSFDRVLAAAYRAITLEILPYREIDVDIHVELDSFIQNVFIPLVCHSANPLRRSYAAPLGGRAALWCRMQSIRAS